MTPLYTTSGGHMLDWHLPDSMAIGALFLKRIVICEVLTMIIFLVAGIACLALSAFQLTRPRQAADRERRGALEAVRSSAATGGGEQSEAGAVGVARRAWPRCSCAST